MERAAACCQVELNRASVGEQADAIPALRCDLRKGERRIDGVVQFRNSQIALLLLYFLLYLSAQKTSGIEHNPNGLTTLHLENARCELMPACCRRPADVANIVALLVIAQAFEFAAVAALAATPPLHFNLAAADQIKSVLASLLKVGKDTHGLRNFRDGPSLREPQPALVTQIQAPQPVISALAGKDLVTGARSAFCRNDQFERGRSNSKRYRGLIGRETSNSRLGKVSNREGHLAGPSQLRRYFPGPPCFHLFGLGHSKQIRNKCQHDDKVP